MRGSKVPVDADVAAVIGPADMAAAIGPASKGGWTDG